jgi:hypothetical protein
LDHFFAVRMARVNEQLDEALESHKGEITSAIETLKSAIEFASTVDLDLRKARIAAYQPLWKLTDVLPSWPRNQNVTYGELDQFSTDMREWYFGQGGLYLSEPSMKAYRELQDKIWSVLEPLKKREEDYKSRVQGAEARDPESHYDSIRFNCSRLRSNLTIDILSRREAPPQVGSPRP